MPNVLKVFNLSDDLSCFNGSHLIGYLNDVSYDSLKQKLGEPTYCGLDWDKTTITWYVEFGYCMYFTVYNYVPNSNIRSPQYVKNNNREWHIGGFGLFNDFYALTFINFLKENY